MKTIGKQAIAERDELQNKLGDAASEYTTALDEYNTAMQEEWRKVEAAVQNLNDAIAEANQWRSDVAAAIQEYMDGKSDKWQESDRGQAYASWKSEWEDSDLEEVSHSEPDDLTDDTIDYVEALGNYPEEFNG